MTLVVITLGALGSAAQQSPIPLTADSTAAINGLDLYAAAELFKDSENLEKFEQALNDHENGVNNLDLNEDGAVDFVRVSETVQDDTRLIVLQAALGADDFQDVATFAIEREPAGSYNLQVQGDPTFYGADYYVVPAEKDFSHWSVVRWLFRPNYRSYVSPYSYKNHPRWWSARRPLAATAYRTRVGLFAGRKNFTTSRTVRVKTITKVNYRPRASASVKKTSVTRVTTANPRGGNRATTTIKQTNTRVVRPGRRRN